MNLIEPELQKAEPAHGGRRSSGHIALEPAVARSVGLSDGHAMVIGGGMAGHAETVCLCKLDISLRLRICPQSNLYIITIIIK